jgi:hypothetical protein
MELLTVIRLRFRFPWRRRSTWNLLASRFRLYEYESYWRVGSRRRDDEKAKEEQTRGRETSDERRAGEQVSEVMLRL